MWSSIKGALFTDAESPAPAKVAPAAPTQPVHMPQTPGTPGIQVPVENRFVEVLRKAITARQTAFTSLLAAADKLASIIPDPIVRLKAAYATVSGEGRGLREVVAAIDFHMSDMEGQKAQFMSVLKTQQQQAIGTIETELNGIPISNENAMKQIQTMTQQITQLQELLGKNAARESELRNELASQQATFTMSQQEFESALATVKGELEGQRMAITSTLTN
jgi:chromosome segregation ATPase